MLAADERLAKSKAEQTRLTDSNNELQMAVLLAKSKSEEDAARFEQLETRIAELEDELKDSLGKNRDGLEQLAAMR